MQEVPLDLLMVSGGRYSHVTAWVYKQIISSKQTSALGEACFRKQMFDCLNCILRAELLQISQQPSRRLFCYHLYHRPTSAIIINHLQLVFMYVIRICNMEH